MDNSNTTENIGYIIKKLREEKGVTKKELAKGVCSPSYLSRIESGTRCPTSYILRQLSYKLKVTPEYLFELAESSSALESKAFIRKLILLMERDELNTILNLIKDNKDELIFTSVYDKQLFNVLEIIAYYTLNNQYKKGIIELDNQLYLTHNNEEVLTDLEIAIISTQAHFYMLINQHDVAYSILKKLQKHLESSIRITESHSVYSKIYIRLTLASISLGKYNEALEYINAGLLYCKKNNFLNHLSHFYYLKAIINYLLSNYNEYEILVNKARTFDEITGLRNDKLKDVILERINSLN